MKRNLIIAAIVFALAGGAIYQNLTAKGETLAIPTEVAPKANFLAPNFTLEALDGQTYRVGGTREKPVLVNFWASWCGPCEAEAPDLEHVYEKYKDNFDLYGVNMTKNDNIEDATDLVKQYHLTYPILLDKEGTTADLYRFSVVPTSFLIDRNGVIVDVFHVLDPKELERKIKKVIND